MYRIVFVCMLFVILLPVIWRIVNRACDRIEKALSKPDVDPKKTIDKINRDLDNLDRIQKQAEEDAERARNATQTIMSWAGSTNNTITSKETDECTQEQDHQADK